MKTLISIVGPTAIGKTALGIFLGKTFNTEIISADSRQFYREMTIGTAKPTINELKQVPHHFINSHSIHQPLSAGDFEKEGLEKVDLLFQKYDLLIMLGGSGLYVNALIEGLDDLPKPEESIRNLLNESFKEKGLVFLQERLKRIDPSYFKEVDISNPQRMIRAIEVFESTGVPFSHWRKKNKKTRSFRTLSIGLDMDREHLYSKINQRVDSMINSGLLNEVQSLYDVRNTLPLKTVGYTELFDFIEGKHTLEEAIRKVKQNTRKYAKRQLTWFKKNEGTTWFHPDDSDAIISYIKSRLL